MGEILENSAKYKEKMPLFKTITLSTVSVFCCLCFSVSLTLYVCVNVSMRAYGKCKFKVLKKSTAKYFPALGVNELFIISLKQKETILKIQTHLTPLFFK